MEKQHDPGLTMHLLACLFRGRDILRMTHEANMGMHAGTGKKTIFVFWGLAAVLCCAGSLLDGQSRPEGAPSVTAAAKGPNQINLTWPPVSNPIDGYLVEIQSDADSRYSSYAELQPIPKAGGYTCNPSVHRNGGSCNISDPSGAHVYNPPTNGIPYWVTETTYIDPQDGTPAQFIAWGLKPNTSYNFRVRSYSGNTFGSYSVVATAITANYALRIADRKRLK
jgi:hypothetical protein